MNAEQQLLGCILHMRDSKQVQAVRRLVPAEAITDTLNRAIYTACINLADRGKWDPALVPREVHLNGWPRDIHHQVTGRIVDLHAGCVFPAAWQPAAAEVRETYTRRRLASVLNSMETALADQPLDRVAEILTDAVEIASTSQQITAGMLGGDTA